MAERGNVFDVQSEAMTPSVQAGPGSADSVGDVAGTTAVELAEQHAPQGIHVIDASVGGGAGAATKSELATMVGAPGRCTSRSNPHSSAGRRWSSMPGSRVPVPG